MVNTWQSQNLNQRRLFLEAVLRTAPLDCLEEMSSGKRRQEEKGSSLPWRQGRTGKLLPPQLLEGPQDVAVDLPQRERFTGSMKELW